MRYRTEYRRVTKLVFDFGFLAKVLLSLVWLLNSDDALAGEMARVFLVRSDDGAGLRRPKAGSLQIGQDVHQLFVILALPSCDLEMSISVLVIALLLENESQTIVGPV